MATPTPGQSLSLQDRVRRAQTGAAARDTIAEQVKKAAEDARMPSLLDVSGLTSGQTRLENQAKATNARLQCLIDLLEEVFGAKDDLPVWSPFAFDVPAGSQVVHSAVVDQDVLFFYTGYGAPQIPGVSYTEIIDGSQGPVHFTPPCAPDDTDEGQYGPKGRRVLFRVDLVIQNTTGAPVSIDGWFRGRQRKGGRS